MRSSAHAFEMQMLEEENQIAVQEEELRRLQKEDRVIRVPHTDSSG